MSDSKEELVAQLNSETAKISWQELERHFARGSVVKISHELDLLETAVLFANDDAANIKKLMEKQLVSNAQLDDAKVWNEYKPDFWAVVIAPWVLVQEIKPKLNS